MQSMAERAVQTVEGSVTLAPTCRELRGWAVLQDSSAALQHSQVHQTSVSTPAQHAHVARIGLLELLGGNDCDVRSVG